MTESTGDEFSWLLQNIRDALGHSDSNSPIALAGDGMLPSVFPVSDLAAASVGAAGLALGRWIEHLGVPAPAVTVDRRLASLWFGIAIRPMGWKLAPAWDAVAGDYRTRDGWIRLHTNAPHHRAAALSVLKVEPNREAVSAAVAKWDGLALEQAVVAAHGCAAQMRSMDAWREHPQGRSVAGEPLIAWSRADAGPAFVPRVHASRPLHGIRVLDLTRVLAGPIATRWLAGYGADVLRIDPPEWDEPPLVPDTLLGKRSARLDFKQGAGRERLLELLRQADVMVHGYRADALENAGLGEAVRTATRPGLVEVSLDAYGWSGPWSKRRGFDSLVQMSSGIAEAGMRINGRDIPTPLPVQALDHATGYLIAASVVEGLTRRAETGHGWRARASLARTATLLMSKAPKLFARCAIEPRDNDLAPGAENTAWGPARRVAPPLRIDGTPMLWGRAAGPIGQDQASWSA